jgi:drug/metabolite transporter (DMT)-like permease
MAPKEGVFSTENDGDDALSNENDDKLELDDTPAEPIVFVPSTISTVIITDLPLLTKTSRFTRFSGIIYTLIASFIFTGTAFLIKQLGVDLLDALLLRFIIQTIITFLFILYKRYSLFPGTTTQTFLQILCCTTGAGGFFAYLFAIRYVEISDVVTLCYTRVVWTFICSIFVYHERPSISSLLALPLTVLGVVFVTQPSFLFSSAIPSIITVNNKYRILGLTLSIICSFTTTANVFIFKQLISTSKDIKPSVLNFEYCFTVLILLIINQLYNKFFLHTGISLNSLISWKYLFASLTCFSMILASILTQKAIKREHPAIFTLLGSAEIIFALILQNLFTKKRSNLFALLGSALVICSVAIIGLSKILNERRAEKKKKLIDNKTILKDSDEKC